MHARMPNRSELARGRPAPQEWARIDPTIYVTAARRLQARATTEAIGVAWRGIRRGLTGLAGLARRHLLEPLARRAQRRRAHADLAAMDDRLLADIGLRRSDIQLALSGRQPPFRATACSTTSSTRQQPPPPTPIDGPRRRARTGIPTWRRKRSLTGHELDDRRGCAAARADQPVAKAHCDDGRTFDAIRRDELELTARTPSGQAC